MDIGFVGLGAMGAGIVPRLMAAGHTVTGWNRSKDRAEPLIKSENFVLNMNVQPVVYQNWLSCQPDVSRDSPKSETREES